MLPHCLSLNSFYLFLTLGIGALYVRRRPRVRVEPLMSGGGQERGLRSGTLPAPLVVGLGKACEVSLQEMEVILKENLFRIVFMLSLIHI